MTFSRKVQNTYHTQKKYCSVKEGPSYSNISGKLKDGATIKQDILSFSCSSSLSKFHKKCGFVPGYKHFSICAWIVSDWEEANFLHSSPHPAVLHIGSWKGFDNTLVFWIPLSSASNHQQCVSNNLLILQESVV